MPDTTFTPSRSLRPSEFALRLMVSCGVVYAVAGGIAYLLIDAGKRFLATHGQLPGAGSIPPALWAGTVLLATGSFWMHRAVGSVRLERQRPFRRALLAALGVGTLFVGVQSFGLWCLLQRRWEPPVIPGDTNVAAFLFVGLHALHFLLALLALVYVTILAMSDRYDHEYHWGVTACASFWHFLGVVWIVILGVMALIL